MRSRHWSGHGPLKGTWLAVRRLLRCHPWNPGGVDHVPREVAVTASVARAHDAAHRSTDHPRTPVA